MKTFTKLLIAIVLICIAAFLYFWTSSPKVPAPGEQPVVTSTTTPSEGTPRATQTTGGQSVIGKSVEGRDITAYHFGTGATKILFVGGIHGGYSWNTSLVAYELIDYLTKTPSVIPAKVQVTVIPVLNPDGLKKVVGTADRFTKEQVSTSAATVATGRFNTNSVDLNRNFDCDWKATGTWQNKAVSGGSKAFSEPESAALKAYIEANTPSAVIVWFSAAGGVFSSNCGSGVSTATREITNLYAKASGYPAHESFDFYETTGDVANWLSKKNIPAISVLLTTHADTEWSKNQAGIDAVFQKYTN